MKEPNDPAGHELDELVESLFANAPIGVYIVENQRFRFANSQFAKDLGYLREELLGMDSLSLVVPNDRQMVQESAIQMLRGNRTSPYEFRVLTKSGAMRWVLGGVVPIRHRGRQATLGYYLDVSDQAEFRRQREQELANIYNTVSDVIYMLAVEKDGRYRFVSVNEAFRTTTGISLEQVVGKRIDEIIPEPSLTKVLEKYSEAIQEKRTVRWEETSEYPTGRLVGEVSVAPVFDETDKCTHLVGAVHDVTERKRLEEALLESNRLLEQTMAEMKVAQRHIVQQQRLQALGQMASGIAHDFNNALTPILGFSQMLLTHPENLQNTEAAIRYLEMINLAAKDAATVVGRLRDFYRTREASESFVPVSLHEIVGQAISLTQARWKDQAQANGITIEIETRLEGVPPVMGNQAELRQALANLILNAVDAMPKGGKITLSTRKEEDHSVLSVSDTGTGMSEEVRRRCLEPFFTSKGEQGSGMGLPMVYGTIQRHGGTLEIETEVGRGSTFTIRLPITMPKSTEAELTETVVNRLHILVVDDQPMVSELVSEFLKADGHTVEVATNGKDALEKFAASSFDLVVTDRAMPKMSGDQLAVAIKTVAPSTRVILLTGIGSFMQDAKERPEGVNVVLAKPPSLTELRHAIRSCFTGGSGDEP